jgi:TPP-dependent 2-oxoacid decarboxylase
VILINELDSAQFIRYVALHSREHSHTVPPLNYPSVTDVTSNLNFAAATIISNPATAVSQISRVLDVMMYESKPVFIGLSLAVAGQIISISQTPSTGSSNTPGQYSSTSTPGQYASMNSTGTYANAADASKSSLSGRLMSLEC